MFRTKNGSLRDWVKISAAAACFVIVMRTIIPTHQHHHDLTDDNKLQKGDDDDDESPVNDDKSYFVNTVGCRMPSFQMTTPKISQYFFNVTPYTCRPAMSTSNGTHLWIGLNKSEIARVYGVTDPNKLLCTIVPFVRDQDKRNRMLIDRYQYLRYGDSLRITDEFIKIECIYDDLQRVSKNRTYLDYHYFVPPAKATAANRPDSDKISVLIVGIDAVSRLNLHRQMPETVSVLLNDLNAIELFGYNKVGDNTYPNLVPVLSGHSPDELERLCLPYPNSTFDECPFVWTDYRQRGYTTALGEDMAWLGLFNYARNGFHVQPTDYRMRPFIYEMEQNIVDQHVGNCYMCLGGRRPADIMLDYMRKFLQAVGRWPFFALFWTVSYTHDALNTPRLIDSEYASFLRELKDGGAAQNAFVFVMSDHGLRWGDFRATYQGLIEERQPFLYLIPPIGFGQRYPMAERNAWSNRHKLTTPFDLYETIKDLLRPTESLSDHKLTERTKQLKAAKKLPRGLSLFMAVPPTRTCADAGITPHWCTCHESTPLSIDDKRVRTAAERIVRTMNEAVAKEPHCRRLELNRISDANLGIPTQNVTANSQNHFADISVRLRTTPGEGEFEATVRLHDDGTSEMTGSISRTNLYGNQSHCVENAKLKLYCFCDDGK